MCSVFWDVVQSSHCWNVRSHSMRNRTLLCLPLCFSNKKRKISTLDIWKTRKGRQTKKSIKCFFLSPTLSLTIYLFACVSLFSFLLTHSLTRSLSFFLSICLSFFSTFLSGPLLAFFYIHHFFLFYFLLFFYKASLFTLLQINLSLSFARNLYFFINITTSQTL